MTPLMRSLIEYVKQEIGDPHFAITLTLMPIQGARRQLTKRLDAEHALSWFLHLLNTRCFGHGHRRKKFELGFFAALEGLNQYDEVHWHITVRLPHFLSRDRFLTVFEIARKRTRRLGYVSDLQPYYGDWIEYSLKSGPDSFCPQFLRAGTP